MKKTFDKETGKKTWELETWPEKTVYVIGFILLAFYALCFIFGFVAGFAAFL